MPRNPGTVIQDKGCTGFEFRNRDQDNEEHVSGSMDKKVLFSTQENMRILVIRSRKIKIFSRPTSLKKIVLLPLQLHWSAIC
jgi:hypothetical protein